MEREGHSDHFEALKSLYSMYTVQPGEIIEKTSFFFNFESIILADKRIHRISSNKFLPETRCDNWLLVSYFSPLV